MREVAVARLGQALDQFIERPPNDLPDGLLDRLKELRSEVDTFHPEEPSPGKQAAKDAMVPGSLPKPEPKESPGQQAAREGADRGRQAGEALRSLAAAVSGDRAGAS